MSRSVVALAVVIGSVTACGGGCGKKDAGEPAAAPAANAAPAKAPGGGAGTGILKGTVKLKGRPPAREAINMKSDSYCAGKQGEARDDEVMVGTGGGLKNVVVRVAQGLAEKYSPRAEEVVMDQEGCTYRPRVLVAQAGQVVMIKNSDQTLHNIHTYKGAATLFNQAEIFGMPPIRKKFPTPGDVIKFKCDVHPWMTAYMLVTDNPFHATTDENGAFTIRDIPAGTYKIELWHEKLKPQTTEVVVTAGGTSTLDQEITLQ
jgi:plastocyanin